MNNTQKYTLYILGAVLLWLLVLLFTYNPFMTGRGDEPLYLVSLLFPLFNLLIVGMVFLGYFVGKNKQPSWFHLLFLYIFALMLFVTPHLMTDFTREPDSVWHTGISDNVIGILGGDDYQFSWYAESYPVSFVLNKLGLTVTDASVPVYANYIFPFFYMLLFVGLLYLIFRKLSGNQVAFFSLLLAFPVLHYLKVYPAPQTIGTIFALAAIYFIIDYERLSSALIALVLLIVSFFAHPILPLFPVLLFISLVIARAYRRKKFGTVEIAAFSVMAFGGFMWLMVSLFSSRGVGAGLLDRISSALSFEFTKGFEVINEYLLGAAFLYQEIFVLNKIVYLVCVLFLLGILYYLKYHTKYKFDEILLGNLTFCFLIMLSTLGVVILSGTQVLIERGLTFIMLFISFLIVYSLSQVKKKNVEHNLSLGFVVGLIVIASVFPLMAYSMEDYNNFPSSELEGMKFLENDLDINNKSLFLSMPAQMAMLIDEGVEFSNYPTVVDPEETQLDIFAFRDTGYYYIALRLEADLEDNSFVEARETIEELENYNKVYENKNFEVFLKR